MAVRPYDFRSEMINAAKAAAEAKQLAAEQEAARIKAETEAKNLAEFKAIINSPEFAAEDDANWPKLLNKAKWVYICGNIANLSGAEVEGEKLIEADKRYEAKLEADRIARERRLSVEDREKSLKASAEKAARAMNEAIANSIMRQNDANSHCFAVIRALVPHIGNYNSSDITERKAARKAYQKYKYDLFWIGKNLTNQLDGVDGLKKRVMHDLRDIAHKLSHRNEYITVDELRKQMSKKYYTVSGAFILKEGGILNIFTDTNGNIAFSIFKFNDTEKEKRLGIQKVYGEIFLTKQELDANAVAIAQAKAAAEAEAMLEEDFGFGTIFSGVSTEVDDDEPVDLSDLPDMEDIFGPLDSDSNSDSNSDSDGGNQD